MIAYFLLKCYLIILYLNIFFFLSLGVYCNSPSACFVASDGQSLRLYQAVIEAKKLLSELSNPEISVSKINIAIFLHTSVSYSVLFFLITKCRTLRIDLIIMSDPYGVQLWSTEKQKSICKSMLKDLQTNGH